MFPMLDTACTDLQVSMIEVLYISKYQPVLCEQKVLYFYLFC